MKKYLLLFLLSLPSFLSTAQTVPGQLPNAPGEVAPQPGQDPAKRGKILDDSTKQIYGPSTSRYFLEEDVFNNRKTLYQIDTGYVNFHRYDFQEKNGKWYTDLGSIGTSLRPLFFEAPQQIGAQLGYDNVTPYGINPYQVKYYDTKSPYTEVYYVQGGRGQSVLKFDLSRNVTSQWNLGIHVERYVGQRQIAAGAYTSNRQRELAGHWNFVAHTNYHTKDDKYAILAHYNIFEHTGRETGGINAGKDPTKANWDSLLATPAEASELLTQALMRDRRNQFHVYQEYVPVKGFQVYHVGDFTGRYYRFRDNAYQNSISTGFYNNLPKQDQVMNRILPSVDSVQASAHYWLLENKVGLKGAYKGFNYRLHVRRRDYSVSQWSRYTKTATDTTIVPRELVKDSLTINERYITGAGGFMERATSRRNENFLGAWVAYYFRDSTRLEAEGEYLVGGDYRLFGKFYGKWFKATFTSTLNSPTLLQERFISPLLRWDNNLSNVFTNQIQASAPIKIKDFFIEPSIHYSLTTNHIYFDTASVVRQESSPISIYKLGLNLSWRRGKFSTTHQGHFTTTSGPDLIRMPQIMTLSRVAFDFVYSKVMYVQVGIDAHYRSGYYADFYQPLTGQFFLNDKFRVPGYLQLDAFADVRINRVRLFVQLRNAGDGIIPKGFFPTPFHPGLKRTFGFGVIWPLFD